MRELQSPFEQLMRSRKFLLLVWTTIGAAALLIVSQFFPQYVLFVERLLGIVAPVVIAVIIGITVEDAAEKLRGVFERPDGSEK